MSYEVVRLMHTTQSVQAVSCWKTHSANIFGAFVYNEAEAYLV